MADSRRQRILSSDGGILRYLKRGRGGVYAVGNRRRAPSPLRLAQTLCRRSADIRGDFAERLNAAPNASLRAVIDKAPPDFMSDTAKDFAYRAVAESKAELLRSVE